jgi:HK97 family phage major capsid protein
MRKTFLEKRKARLAEKRDALTNKALASENADEVRSINAQIAEINDELEDVNGELEVLAEEERNANPQSVPANAELRNGQKVGSYKVEERHDDPYASMEYRKAFMAYAQTGKAIPEELRDGAAANTSTLGATIPTTILNEFINEIRKRYGNLYAKVRKMNIPGAVKVPIAKLQASFKWITEETVSPRQDGGTISDYVEFSYNMAEIRVSQTLLSSIVSIDLFEREIVNVMMIAYMKAMDSGIVNGSGVGQMLGILNDTRVTNQVGHVIEFTADDMGDWQYWRKSFFAKLPLGYRDGEFIFPISTVDSYLETMADDNGNPIFRQATGLEVNDGDARDPNGRFFGRAISLVEPDILPDFDSANANDIVGIFWQPQEYAINTNMQFGMRRWFDEDRNEWVNKMLTVVDGKVLNPCGIYLIKKVSSHE